MRRERWGILSACRVGKNPPNIPAVGFHPPYEKQKPIISQTDPCAGAELASVCGPSIRRCSIAGSDHRPLESHASKANCGFPNGLWTLKSIPWIKTNAIF